MVTQFLRTRVGTWKEGWAIVCKITLAPCCSCISQSTEWTQTTALIKSVTIRKWAQGVYQIRGWQKRSQFYTCSLSALMVRGTGAELETVMTAHHHAWKPFKNRLKISACVCEHMCMKACFLACESSFASGHSRMMTSALTSHLSFSLKYDRGLITATTHDLLTKQYDPGTVFLPVKYKDISHISCNSSHVLLMDQT